MWESHSVGYTNVGDSSCWIHGRESTLVVIILLNYKTLCYYYVWFYYISSDWYRILIDTQSSFILPGFTWFPKVYNWIRHQYANLKLSSRHLYGTQTYKLTHIDTQYATVKSHQREEIGGFLDFSRDVLILVI